MPSRPKKLRVCTDMFLPPELRGEAQLLAMELNPANAIPAAGGLQGQALELAILVAKKWPVGCTIRVRFLGGHPELQQKVAAVAQQWTEFANIKFDFQFYSGTGVQAAPVAPAGPPPSNQPEFEIRVAFQQDGRSWSRLGVDALVIAKDQPTMNYGWLTKASNDEEIRSVVLHEFGHALGCVHEHKSPESPIQWNEKAVLNYYMGPPNNWTEKETRFNVLDRYSADLTQYTVFDPKSIMIYWIRKEWTLNGYEVPSNSALSDTDKEFIGKIYRF